MDSTRALFGAFVVLQIVQPLIPMTSCLDLLQLVSTKLPSSLAKAVDIVAVAVAVVVVDDDAVAVAAGDDCAAVYYSVAFVVYLNSNSNRRTR